MAGSAGTVGSSAARGVLGSAPADDSVTGGGTMMVPPAHAQHAAAASKPCPSAYASNPPQLEFQPAPKPPAVVQYMAIS